MFVQGKPFEPSLMFTVKGERLRKDYVTFWVPYSWVGSCPNPQTVD